MGYLLEYDANSPENWWTYGMAHWDSKYDRHQALNPFPGHNPEIKQYDTDTKIYYAIWFIGDVDKKQSFKANCIIFSLYYGICKQRISLESLIDGTSSRILSNPFSLFIKRGQYCQAANK